MVYNFLLFRGIDFMKKLTTVQFETIRSEQFVVMSSWTAFSWQLGMVTEHEEMESKYVRI